MKLLNELTQEDIVAIQNDNKKFDKLVVLNRGFIESIINPFRQNFNYDDMFQTASISLWKAIQKYDAEKEDASSFSTFARVVIQRDVWGHTKKQNKIFQNENSIESYKSENDNGTQNSEYNESYFKKPQDINLEDHIINKIYQQDILKELSDVEQKIYDLKINKDMSMREISTMIGVNLHTLKYLTYVRLSGKLEKHGIYIKRKTNENKKSAKKTKTKKN